MGVVMSWNARGRKVQAVSVVGIEDCGIAFYIGACRMGPKVAQGEELRRSVRHGTGTGAFT